MTWKELAKQIEKLPKEVRDENIRVYIPSLDEYTCITKVDNSRKAEDGTYRNTFYYLRIVG